MKRIIGIISDHIPFFKKVYLFILYYRRTNKILNLKNPKTFNEKLQWLKIYWYDKRAAEFSDKILFRDYMKSKNLSSYMTKIIGKYENFEAINFDELPSEFVIKMNHGSGYNYIVKDKSKINIEDIKRKILKWSKRNYYYNNLEWVYKNIKPQIFIEEYIEGLDKDNVMDYRVFCFSGVPEFITVDININEKKKTKRNLFDLSWNLLPYTITYPQSIKSIKKPENLEKMLSLSEFLSQGFPHCRIDFYSINTKLYISEVTFFHQSGMGEIEPLSFDEKLGDLIEIDTIKRRKINENYN